MIRCFLRWVLDLDRRQRFRQGWREVLVDPDRQRQIQIEIERFSALMGCKQAEVTAMIEREVRRAWK